MNCQDIAKQATASALVAANELAVQKMGSAVDHYQIGWMRGQIKELLCIIECHKKGRTITAEARLDNFLSGIKKGNK